MLGSGVFAGVLDKQQAYGSRDLDGRVFGEELDRVGYRGEAPCGDHALDSYFELHIEQGPVLEAESAVIGVVTGVQGMRWYDVVLTGSAGHAGTTPMALRRDALVTGAEVVVAVNRLAGEIGQGALTTNGVFESHPNSRNVVPDRVFLTVDLRHTEVAVLDQMEAKLETLVTEIGARRGVASSLTRIWDSPPVTFHPECVGAVREAASASEQPLREITSGAGHDAVYLSRVAPTAMIFIPCKDGLSHNELESAEPEHVGAGASVLLWAVLARDRRSA
jgi:N-carbamoyl-L-amino-acid hydrolase